MLLDTLKEQTRQQHTALEELHGLPHTLPDYLMLLETFFGFVEPWERRVAERLSAHDPIRAGREKTAWLRADLAYFGYTAEAIAALPRWENFPETRSRTEILGAAYVLEGSTLGGQFISAHLERELGLAKGQGDTYFRSYGSQIGAQWQAFRQELTRHSSPENDPVIVRAAQDMFTRLNAWFSTRKVHA